MLLRQKQRAALLLSTKEMKQILEEQEENKYRADLGLCEIEIPCSVPTYLNQKTCIIHLLKRNEVEGPILFSLLSSKNTSEFDLNHTMAMRGDFFLLFADKSVQPDAFFAHQSYENYRELKNEFRAKIGTYVKKGFDWEQHIGYIQYIYKEEF